VLHHANSTFSFFCSFFFVGTFACAFAIATTAALALNWAARVRLVLEVQGLVR
jgi:hypothetical protein